MLTIKSIDAQRNGFVTKNELDDIIKQLYKEELGDKDIGPFIGKFSSLQNKILIDYRSFKDWL